jgi:hypothetical protein
MFIELTCAVSLWMHSVCAVFRINHAGAEKSPELRTLFFQLRTLLKLPLHAVFVFDGLQRLPDKGRNIRSSHHWLTRDFQRMLELFGFPWTEVFSLPLMMSPSHHFHTRPQAKLKRSWLP